MSDASFQLVSYRGMITVDHKKHLMPFGEVLLSVTPTQPLAGTYPLADLAQLNMSNTSLPVHK